MAFSISRGVAAKFKTDDRVVRIECGEVVLWREALLEALLDLRRSERPRREALPWFTADCCGIGSFIWVCEIIALDASAVWRSLVGQATGDPVVVAQVKDRRAIYLGSECQRMGKRF